MRSGAPPSSGLVGAAVGVGDGLLQHALGARPALREDHADAGGRRAGDRVQHVRGEAAVRLRLAGPVHRLDEPQPRDVADLRGAPRRAPCRGVLAEPALEVVEDGVARVPAHADDERKAEALAIGRVQPLEARELRLAQPVETEAALLPARLPPSWRRRARPCCRAPGGRGSGRAARPRRRRRRPASWRRADRRRSRRVAPRRRAPPPTARSRRCRRARATKAAAVRRH